MSSDMHTNLWEQHDIQEIEQVITPKYLSYTPSPGAPTGWSILFRLYNFAFPGASYRGGHSMYSVLHPLLSPPTGHWNFVDVEAGVSRSSFLLLSGVPLRGCAAGGLVIGRWRAVWFQFGVMMNKAPTNTCV